MYERSTYRETKAAIYAESKKDLMEQLDKFADFPGCLERFGEAYRSYHIKPTVFKVHNQKGEYIYKQDAFTLLWQQLPKLPKDDLAKQFIDYICQQYVKCEENELRGECELIPYDPTVFETFEKGFDGYEKRCKESPPPKSLDDLIESIRESFKNVSLKCFNSLKDYYLKDDSLEEDSLKKDSLKKKLEGFEKNHKFNEHLPKYHKIMSITREFITKMEDFIRDNPNMFRRAEKPETHI